MQPSYNIGYKSFKITFGKKNVFIWVSSLLLLLLSLLLLLLLLLLLFVYEKYLIAERKQVLISQITFRPHVRDKPWSYLKVIQLRRRKFRRNTGVRCKLGNDQPRSGQSTTITDSLSRPRDLFGIVWCRFHMCHTIPWTEKNVEQTTFLLF